MEFVYELVYIYLHLGIYDRECNWSYWPLIILIECNCCRGRWMVWVTGSHLSSMLPDHNTNSTRVINLSTIRQSTVSRQLVSPSPITKHVFLNALRTIIEHCPTQVACLFTILVACVRLTNFQFKQIFGDMVQNHVWSGVRPGGVLELLFTL